ncbi:epsin-1 isoform X2 [Planococcus citri]|uniref:epsin-1 isoform X2 n=1 Tax=Planococcus citri TaxID=170843 RepID=UPI0031F937B0
MRRREDIQVNVAGLRRNIKNLTHNYSDAQVKVREATSNDHWGPRSSLMAEIADLTYNVVAYSEIMNMIWKRLNDHGKNWRHVYKALLLLEYLIKTGSEKVAQQCKENIFAIETLRDFQYVEDGKDSGLNVREKAKQLVILLKDDERLRNDRIRALKAKERFAQAASFSSDIVTDKVFTPVSPQNTGSKDSWNSCSSAAEIPTKAAEIECARPQTAGEEELQLQLALAMSREEAEQEEQKRRSDDVRLQLALSQSEKEFKMAAPPTTSHLADLLEIDPNIGLGPQPPLIDPWGMPISAPTNPVGVSLSRSQKGPWSVTSSPSLPSATPSSHSATPSTTTTSPDPWAPAALSSHSNTTHSRPTDPWRTVSPKIDSELASILPPSFSGSAAVKNSDPWAPQSSTLVSSPASEEDEFAAISNRNTPNHQNGSCTSPNAFDLSALDNSLPQSNGAAHSSKNSNSSQAASANMRKTPQSFLGENSSLVNLDKLITTPVVPPLPVTVQKTSTANPFGVVSAPSNNSMSNMSLFAKPAYGSGSKFQGDPFQPVQRNAPSLQQPLMPQPNPFLS